MDKTTTNRIKHQELRYASKIKEVEHFAFKMETTQSINIYILEHKVKQGDSDEEDKYLDVSNKIIPDRSNNKSNNFTNNIIPS